MYDTFHISQQQAQGILAMLHIYGPVEVTFIRAHNHTYRLDCQQQSFFLKAHTKDWYAPEEPETGYSVAHEASAWAILSAHGLATPDVMLACQGRDNPLRWSFLLTRQIVGTSLVELLEQATMQERDEMLYAIGEYLRRMHAIMFAYAGYIFGNGPIGPPDENSWQHPIWTLQQRQRSTREWIYAKLAHGPAQLLQQLEEQVERMPEVLYTAYIPPHFVHGDCGPDQIFMKQENGKWQVAAFLDMEVASAGDSGADVVSLCMQLAQRFSHVSRWWLPLFTGYGSIPDFDGFRLRLLAGWYPYMTNIWPGASDIAFWHILHAKDWDTLFSHAHLKPRN